MPRTTRHTRSVAPNDMRNAVEHAVDRLLDVIHNQIEDDDEATEVMCEAILKMARVGVLALVQIAQDLNELKHDAREREQE